MWLVLPFYPGDPLRLSSALLDSHPGGHMGRFRGSTPRAVADPRWNLYFPLLPPIWVTDLGAALAASSGCVCRVSDRLPVGVPFSKTEAARHDHQYPTSRLRGLERNRVSAANGGNVGRNIHHE